MKIIFLDIDGVLNSVEYAVCCHKNNDKSTFLNGMYGLCPVLLSRLKDLVEKTGAKLVLSSTWRRSKLHREHLFNNGLRFISNTPVISDQGVFSATYFFRSFEIQNWLSNHKNIDIEDYVIIDDDSDANIEGHFYKTDYYTGLTQEICNQIIERFNTIGN